MKSRQERELVSEERPVLFLYRFSTRIINGIKKQFQDLTIQQLPPRPRRIRRPLTLHELPEELVTDLAVPPKSTVLILNGLRSLRVSEAERKLLFKPVPPLWRTKVISPLVQMGQVFSGLSDSLALLSSEEEIRQLQLALMLAMTLIFIEQVATFALSRAVQQQPVLDPMAFQASPLAAQRVWPQAPNPQRLFAPQYYRPAAPRRPAVALPLNEQRLSAAHFPDDLVPNTFKCELMSTVMDNPVRLPNTNQICDGAAVLNALARRPENPFNRQPMKMEDAQPELELRGQIKNYVDQVVEGVQAKQKERGNTPLTRADYEAIHQSAMSHLDAPQAPQLKR